ncbi:MAG: hypothetical protein ACKO6N_24040 [Myxococcota bacterium]
MEPIEVIAVCMVTLTFFSVLVMLVLLGMGFKVMGLLKRSELMLEHARNELLPVLHDARKVSSDVRDMVVMARHQAGKAEPVLEESLQNLRDVTVRLRDAVRGITAVFSLLNRLLGSGSKKE